GRQLVLRGGPHRRVRRPGGGGLGHGRGARRRPRVGQVPARRPKRGAGAGGPVVCGAGALHRWAALRRGWGGPAAGAAQGVGPAASLAWTPQAPRGITVAAWQIRTAPFHVRANGERFVGPPPRP